MAWTLVEWTTETTVTWLTVSLMVLFFKRAKGVVMSERCMIPNCQRLAALGKRGLCLVCFSRAKKKVDSGETTWERLAEMRLCKSESNPFDDAYTRAMEGE